jgi:hypothetical protein
METVKEIHIADNVPREITIYTDSKITLQSLKNPKNHMYLIDEIRKKLHHLETTTGISHLRGYGPT